MLDEFISERREELEPIVIEWLSGADIPEPISFAAIEEYIAAIERLRARYIPED